MYVGSRDALAAYREGREVVVTETNLPDGRCATRVELVTDAPPISGPPRRPALGRASGRQVVPAGDQKATHWDPRFGWLHDPANRSATALTNYRAAPAPRWTLPPPLPWYRNKAVTIPVASVATAVVGVVAYSLYSLYVWAMSTALGWFAFGGAIVGVLLAFAVLLRVLAAVSGGRRGGGGRCDTTAILSHRH